MSILIFTPLITAWFRVRALKTRNELIESIAALLALAVAVYVTFWTTLPQLNAFVVLYALFGILFWIGLRTRPRITALALFLFAVLGMAGSIIVHPNPAIPLNQQLLTNELFIILIAPIFYILTALVEERRVVAEEARARAREPQTRA